MFSEAEPEYPLSIQPETPEDGVVPVVGYNHIFDPRSVGCVGPGLSQRPGRECLIHDPLHFVDRFFLGCHTGSP